MLQALTSLNSLFFSIYSSIDSFIYSFYLSNSRLILDILHDLFKGAFNAILIATIVLAAFYFIIALVVQASRYGKPGIKGIKEGKEPFVTIQIPTYNELAALNCARRCLEFDYPEEKVQIIIGDDSNNKGVSRKIDEFAANYPERVLVTRRGKNIGYKPGNLNHMLKFTKGEFIVIFDSDFLPERDFLKKIITPFVHDKNVAVVQAKWNISNFSQNMFSVLGGTTTKVCHNILLPFITLNKGNTVLCGSAEAIRKSDLLNLGGWQAGSLTEDIECSLRLIKLGRRKLVFIDNAECMCESPHTFKDLCKQQMRWAYGVTFALKQHMPGILKSRTVRAKDKFSIILFSSGYLFSIFLVALTFFGVLSLLSDTPAPIDWSLFLSETGRNVLLTSGFVVASAIGLIAARNIKDVPRMIVSSFSIGLAVTYYVNLGIFKALAGRPMKWFMLNKNGNETQQ